MRADRRTGREQLFGDDVTLEEAALTTAVATRPRHADPPAATERRRKLRVVTVVEIGIGQHVPRLMRAKKFADVGAQRLRFRRQANVVESKTFHRAPEPHKTVVVTLAAGSGYCKPRAGSTQRK